MYTLYSICVPIFLSHLSAVGVLEEEVEDGGGDLGADGGPQVHLVALQDVLNVPGPPVCHGPAHNSTLSKQKTKNME